jgi:hypothetical protein
MRQFALDPGAGFARISTCEKPFSSGLDSAPPVTQRPDKSRAEAPDRRNVERILARFAPNAVSAKQSRHWMIT